VRTGIATQHRVPAHDPQLDFSRESPVVYVDSQDSLATPSPWSATPVPPHAIDTTSRVISFVLGFALASLVAWLGSIRDEVPITPIEERVVPAVTPVVTAATEEKIFATTEDGTSLVSPPPAAAAPARLEPAPSTSVPPRPAVGDYRGALALSSSPPGSEVVLNGKVVGHTPVVLSNLPIGSRALVVRREGYSTWSATVRIVANQRTTVKATLVPVPRTGG
jgi:hypothetical protein